MKKQIIQIFHNMIDKDKRSDRYRVEEPVRPADLGITDQADRTGAAATRDVFDKTTDRKNFEKVVNDELRGKQETGCMLISDLDRFKDINEIYGRDTGDAVLRNTANILNACFEECECIGRTGGDIFALWIPGLSEEDTGYIRRQVGMVNDRLLHPVKELPPVSVSVGVSFLKAGDDCRSLGKRASRMLYRVKESGRCGCEISTV
ncbi:MAG: GGDEF domain-containing protein [Lachnospiraceae bacterium]|nr:GGDEF domain-containing protein [Lachnospiraceae bacterium]